MGLLFFFILTYVLGISAWAAIKSRDERRQISNEFMQEPLKHTALLICIASIYLFVLGVFVPVFGEIKVLNADWQLWQVGGVTAVVSWLVVNLLDKK